MEEIKKFIDGFTEGRVENVCIIAVILGFVGIVYSIIAGIWGFAPSENINWKIFGTSAVIMAISTFLIGMINSD